MKSLAKITFQSPINIDNGYTNNPKGTHESTMELFAYPEGYYSIEWCVEALDIVEHIGIEHTDKALTGYDGVFEMPKQAIKLLMDNGWTCETFIREDDEFIEWEGEVIDAVINRLECSRGDAQGVIEAQNTTLINCWLADFEPDNTAQAIDEAGQVKAVEVEADNLFEKSLKESVQRLYDVLEKILELHEKDLKVNDVSWINDDLDYVNVKYFKNTPDGDFQNLVAEDDEEYPALNSAEALMLLTVRIDNALQTL